MRHSVCVGSLRWLAALATALVIPILPRASVAATTTTTLTGDKCMPMTGNFSPSVQGDLQYSSSAHAVKNISAGTVHVICPIVKKTSTFGTAGDNINSIAMTATGGGSISCVVDVWDTTPGSGSTPTSLDPNDGAHVWGPNGQPHTFELSNTVKNINTWDGPSDNFEWRYAEVDCGISAGTTINKYTVVEDGTVGSAPVTIYPPSFCNPTVNQGAYMYFDESGSGFLRNVPDKGNGEFSAGCSIPLNSQNGAYAALIPTDNDNVNTIGCEWNNIGYSSYQSLESQSTGPQVEALSWFGLSASNLVCFVDGALPQNGDAAIVSVLVWTED
jgi:hypothetical protein